MDSSRLSMVGRLVLALLAVLMLGAMIASAAQAAEPTRALVWKVNGTVLKENETKELTAKIPTGAGNLELEAPKLGIKVICEAGNLAKGAFIANEGGANGQAISESIAEFTKCKVKGNGGNCVVVGEKIVTNKIRSELVLNDEAKNFGNKILVEFDPRSAKEFVEIKFEGSECKFKNTQVTELVLALLWTDVNGSAGTEIELGALPAETTSYIIKFPDEPESVFLWSNTNKKFELFKPTQLKFFNEKATLTGQLLILLASGEKYGLSETVK